MFIERKKMVCLITPIDFFLSIQPFMRPLFSGQQQLSNLDYYLQDGGKTGAQTNQSFWKLNNIFWWSKVSHIIIKGWNFMIKSFSGQFVFCFAILRAISAYVGENWLSKYMQNLIQIYHVVQELWAFSLTYHRRPDWCSAESRSHKECFACQWLDDFDMHMYAKFDKNIPCGSRVMSIFTNC